MASTSKLHDSNTQIAQAGQTFGQGEQTAVLVDELVSYATIPLWALAQISTSGRHYCPGRMIFHQTNAIGNISNAPMPSPQTQRPPRSPPSFVDNPFNIIVVILVPILAGLIVFVLGPNLESAPAWLEKVPTPWLTVFGR
jgi:hypothetical protein